MKKTYFEPAVETISINTTLPLALSVGVDGNKLTNGGTDKGGSSDAKSREDEEAYAVTGGAGEAAYGDLW